VVCQMNEIQHIQKTESRAKKRGRDGRERTEERN